MGFGYRKSRKVGPFRFTLTHRGVSGSAGVGPPRFGHSSSGRRTKSVRILKGLFWRRSRG